MNLRLFAAAATAAAFVMANPAQAALVTLDFESDPSGALAEGFSSTDYAGLALYTDLGAGLELLNGIAEGDGNSLVVQNDTNGNFLKGVFSDGPHTFLSMDFGNDDPSFTNPGDRAVLTVFLGATMVGQTFVIMNRNDLMDQTIGFNFGSFDNFTLAFTDGAGSVFTGGGAVNVGLIEVIDNITFDVPDTVVPEPATWAMMILGFAGTGALMRRRRGIALT